MKIIYFIRHGEAEHLTGEFWAGHTDTELTPHGVEQAKNAGREAKEKNLSFDTIVSSPLKRAHDTARFVAEGIGYPSSNIELNHLFKERHMGELEGTSIHPHYQTFKKDERSIDHFKDVETIDELEARAAAAHEWLKKHPSEKILVVSHGGFGRALKRNIQQGKNAQVIWEEIPNAKFIRFL